MNFSFGKIYRTCALFVWITLCISCSGKMKIVHLNNDETEVSVSAPGRILLLPLEDAAPEATVEETSPGVETRRHHIRLAVGKIDHFVPMYLDGPTVLRITAPSDAVCWDAMRLADSFVVQEDSGFRPIYHHTPPYGWMNDPNGMVWLDGEYHLFYQRNPYGSRWQNMTWGHSVSRDLTTWEHLPDAIAPDSLGTVFSGCAVVDKDNTAGFGKDALIALYTASGNRQTQCIAYSTDRGRTFTKYEGNPVLTKDAVDFRDPKVFWHADSSQWIMVLAVGPNMEFYSSRNLRDWHFESAFGEGFGLHEGVWECPDLIELPVDGNPENRQWVLLCSVNASRGSVVQYFTGDFDGHTFTCNSDPATVKLLDYGQDHYATVTWSNMPDERRVGIGWMSNWLYANDVPTLAFRGANSFPREFRLFSRAGETYLASEPCRELLALRQTSRKAESFEVASEYELTPMLSDNTGSYELTLEFSGITAEKYGLKLLNTAGESVDLCVDCAGGTIALDRTNSGKTDFSRDFAKTYPAPLAASDRCSLRILVDRTSVECFVNGGEVVLSDLVFPTEPYDRIGFYCRGGKMDVSNFCAYELKLP